MAAAAKVSVSDGGADADQADTEMPEADVVAVDETALRASSDGPTSGGVQPMDAEEEEDDDPVVQEIDIYLNRMHDPPDFVGDVYLVQYPCRPSYRPYGDQGLLDKVEVKEKGQRLQMTYELKHNDNYDGDSVISEKLGGKRSVLTSNVVRNDGCSYAVGVIHQGRLTLVPVRATNQLRPDFEDYDKERGGRRSGAAADAAAAGDTGAAGDKAAESGDSGPEDDANVAEVVGEQVRVVFQPTASRGQLREDTTEQDAAEPWSRLDFYDQKSSEAMDIFERHVVWPAATAAQAAAENYEPDHPKLLPLVMEGDREVLLSTMTGQATSSRRREGAAPKQDDSGLSVYVLSKMPPERQVEALARHHVVLSYSRQLRRRLPPGTLRLHKDEQLLGLVRRHCDLVAGNWVLKSELAGYDSVEASCRDLLLMLLSMKNAKLSSGDIIKWHQAVEKCNVPLRTLEEILLSVCHRDQSGNSQLKNPPDDDFRRRYPKLVAEFEAYWQKKRHSAFSNVQKDARRNSTQQAAVSAARREKARLVGEVRESLASGAKTVGELRRHIQKRSTTSVIHEQEILEVLAMPELEVVRVRDLYISGRTGVEANDKLREVLHGLFRRRDKLSLEEVLAEYQKVHSEPCKVSGHVLRGFFREIADRMDGDSWLVKGALAKAGGS